MSALLDRRLIFVTGKGGVGKSTISVALGVLATRRGLRVIVVELANQDRVSRAFGQHGADVFREIELTPGLFTISVDPQRAMDEYLRIKAGALGHVLSSSRVFQSFATAAPGMREMLSIGKIWELAQLERRSSRASTYDLVVVDAPATGHGVGLIRTPKTFSEIARVGPIAHQARTIADTIADRAFTAIVAVATPEEMAVTETLELHETLKRDGLELDAVVMNELYDERFRFEDVAQLRAALDRTESRLARASIRAALSAYARATSQREHLTRLSIALNRHIIELPFLFANELGMRELDQLADALQQGLCKRDEPTRATTVDGGTADN